MAGGRRTDPIRCAGSRQRRIAHFVRRPFTILGLEEALQVPKTSVSHGKCTYYLSQNKVYSCKDK